MSSRMVPIIAFAIMTGLISALVAAVLSGVIPILSFVFFYAIISFIYLFYRYIFATISYPVQYLENRKGSYVPSVSIVLPVYNENKKDLTECIKHACDADYPKKEVIVVDDGSTSEKTWQTVQKLKKKYHFRAYKFKENKGKRCAMAFGFRKAKGEVIITMDSDSTIPSGKSITELVKPLSNKKVGAVSGCVLVNNKKENILTRIQDARYWLAFFIEKSAQNPYNSITCASGPFSAYRRKYVMKFLSKWENQVFLGDKCTYGDDRGLTTFILKSGYETKFVRDAVAYTNVPTTINKFVKQQVRWKKSFIRENWYLARFIFHKNIFMNLEFFLFWTIFILGFVAKILSIILLLIGSISFLGYTIRILFVAFMHYIYAFIKSPGQRGYFGLLYGFLNEFLISWLFFYSLLKLKDTKWGTR